MTEADAPIVWQRVPQGWIELVAFDDDTVAAAWWEAYLSPAREWLDAGTAAAMTRDFDTARETLRTIPYAVAGIFPYLDGEPTVFFLGTTILPAPDDRDAARTVASLVGLVRFGDDMRTESFVALDGRVGSASLGRATLEDGTIVGAITGEIPLPDAERGTVFVLALSLDPAGSRSWAPTPPSPWTPPGSSPRGTPRLLPRRRLDRRRGGPRAGLRGDHGRRGGDRRRARPRPVGLAARRAAPFGSSPRPRGGLLGRSPLPSGPPRGDAGRLVLRALPRLLR